MDPHDQLQHDTATATTWLDSTTTADRSPLAIAPMSTHTGITTHTVCVADSPGSS